MNNKTSVIEIKGIVEERLPNASFRVVLDNGHRLIAYSSGKIRKNRINIVLGDIVIVEISPSDLAKGRVVARQNVQKT